MAVIFRPLGIAKEIVEEMGLSISFEYDDLLFIESNAFLIQFNDEKEKHFNIFLNKELSSSDGERLYQKIKDLSAIREIEVLHAGTFEIREKEGIEGELEIITYPGTKN